LFVAVTLAWNLKSHLGELTLLTGTATDARLLSTPTTTAAAAATATSTAAAPTTTAALASASVGLELFFQLGQGGAIENAQTEKADRQGQGMRPKIVSTGRKIAFQTGVFGA
jgi:hypothetical protein